MMRENPIILFIDLFCGAGGVTTGAVRARMGKYQPVKVVACVNHDPLAIESHEYNHPDTLHFSEDIRTLDTGLLVKIINFYRSKYPNAILCLWASMECTNYSKAKGGMPRDPDSRSLPNEMFRYIDVLDKECGGLDYFKYENVEEFMAWGPLDENGRPVSMKKGQEYLKWVRKIKDRGYRYERRILNSADYGAYTKRKRLFGIFAKNDMPIVWPEPTHSENPDMQNMFGTLKKWKPVRDVLDFDDEGKSIFTRKRPLVENTLKRIYAGLEKYVANGDGFIYKYYGNGNNIEDINGPASTLTTRDRLALVQAAFLDKGFSGVHNHQSIDDPAGAIPTKDHYAVVKAVWLDKQYRSPLNHQSINGPAGSILANPKHSMVQAFIDRQFSQGTQHESIHDPVGAILTVPKMNLVKVKVPWIMDYNYNNNGHDVNNPSPTLLAPRRHFYLSQAKFGKKLPTNKETDCKTMHKIKEFCREYGIVDITTRMLRVPELKRIQGFGDSYYLAGTKTDQKKFIGNSVVPQVVKAMFEALATKLKEEIHQAA